jgi:hypothetical protein
MPGMTSSIILEDQPDRVTEWSSANNTYRFTNVASDRWDVHRAHDLDYVAHLSREGDLYSFRVEEGNPAASGRVLSLSELEESLL